jgi:hypothetical protein
VFLKFHCISCSYYALQVYVAFRMKGKKVAVEAHRVVTRRGSYICYTIGSQIAVSLSALRAGRPLSAQEDTWYSFVLEAESTPVP